MPLAFASPHPGGRKSAKVGVEVRLLIGIKRQQHVYAAAAAARFLRRVAIRDEIEPIWRIPPVDGVHGLEHGDMEHREPARMRRCGFRFSAAMASALAFQSMITSAGAASGENNG